MYPSTSRDYLLERGPQDQNEDTPEKTELGEEVLPDIRNRGLGVRHFQAALSFFGLVVAYCLRLNLSVAVVGMTDSKDYKVNLTPETKALVLSSFFWGYGVFQVASGAFGRRGCAVKLFALGNFGAGIISLMIPLAALNFGFIGICVLRVTVGLVQGNIYPSLNNVMANWAIPQEKDPIMCIVQTGSTLGSLLSMSVSGYLGYNFDWPSIFYASGFLGIIWGIVHALMGGESPETFQRISNEEREYMRRSFRAENKQVREITGGVPWKQILSSGPVIALAITSWCAAWTGWTIATLTPTYINGVLGFNLHDNGLLSSLPYFFSCITSLVLTFVAGLLKRKTTIPESVLRPMWSSIAMYGICVSLMVLAFAPVSTPLAIALLTIGISVGAANNLGIGVNCLDLSPNFAGVVMSITNTTANIASIFGPLISTYLIRDNSNLYEWRMVFVISALLSFFGNSVFLIWGSTKKQSWDEDRSTSEISQNS